MTKIDCARGADNEINELLFLCLKTKKFIGYDACRWPLSRFGIVTRIASSDPWGGLRLAFWAKYRCSIFEKQLNESNCFQTKSAKFLSLDKLAFWQNVKTKCPGVDCFMTPFAWATNSIGWFWFCKTIVVVCLLHCWCKLDAWWIIA